MWNSFSISHAPKELEPQCSYCGSYWHDDHGCPQKPQESYVGLAALTSPCCYCNSPWHIGISCSHDAVLWQAYARLEVQRNELLHQAQMFGSSRSLEEEIEEFSSAMDMLLKKMVMKSGDAKGGSQPQALHEEQERNVKAPSTTCNEEAISTLVTTIEDVQENVPSIETILKVDDSPWESLSPSPLHANDSHLLASNAHLFCDDSSLEHKCLTGLDFDNLMNDATSIVDATPNCSLVLAESCVNEMTSFDSLLHDDLPSTCAQFVPHDLPCIKESLSCDLPPDLGNDDFALTCVTSQLPFDTLSPFARDVDFIGLSLDSILHAPHFLNVILSFASPSSLSYYEHDQFVKHCLELNMLPLASFDFPFALDTHFLANSHFRTQEVLSCDLTPDIFAHACLTFVKCALACVSTSFQELRDFVLHGYQSTPYIVELHPIDPEPPPELQFHMTTFDLDSLLFLIRDENFCYKSLKRFRHTVVPFPHLTFLSFIV